MDNISEILKSIRDRLSSPFIFSFILSWVIYNWQITVGLLWFDASQIKNAGYTSIFDFISCKLPETPLLYPLLCALGYTLIWPFIRMLFAWVQAKASSFSEQLVRHATKETRISAKRYFQFRDEYENQLKILQVNIDSEHVIKGQLEKLTTDLLQAKQENINLVSSHTTKANDLSTQLEALSKEKEKINNSFQTFLTNLRNVSFLDGLWEIDSKADGKKLKYRIADGLMINLEKENDHYRIENYYYDTIVKKMSFTMIPILVKGSFLGDDKVPYSSFDSK